MFTLSTANVFDDLIIQEARKNLNFFLAGIIQHLFLHSDKQKGSLAQLV
jgi:hypothetical protein